MADNLPASTASKDEADVSEASKQQDAPFIPDYSRASEEDEEELPPCQGALHFGPEPQENAEAHHDRSQPAQIHLPKPARQDVNAAVPGAHSEVKRSKTDKAQGGEADDSRKVVCSDFLKNMGCWKGSACPNLHDASLLSQLAERRAGKVCTFYARGSCDKGTACQYFHGEAPVPKAQKEDKKPAIKDERDASTKVKQLAIGASNKSKQPPIGAVTGKRAVAVSKPPEIAKKAANNTPTTSNIYAECPKAVLKSAEAAHYKSVIKPAEPIEHKKRQLTNEKKDDIGITSGPIVSVAPVKQARIHLQALQSDTHYRFENFFLSESRKEKVGELKMCARAVQFSFGVNGEIRPQYLHVCPNSHEMRLNRADIKKKCSGCSSEISAGSRYLFCECGLIFGFRCSLDPYRPQGEASIFAA